MQDENIKNNTEIKPAQTNTATTAVGTKPAFNSASRGGFRGNTGGREKNSRKPSSNREPRVKPEFDTKMILIRRVTRVVAGGKRFQFSVTVVSGNRKGVVGIGLGKGGDTAVAIDKATRNAKKNLVTIPLTKTNSIPHEVYAKYSASEVMIKPAPGRGLVAGSSVRTVLEFAGVKDVTAKIMTGSKNKLNNARAAVYALSKLKANKAK